MRVLEKNFVMEEKTMGYTQKILMKLGQETMISALLQDLALAALEKKPLETSESFRKFLLVLDQMLDDDMILDIKCAIADILP